MYNYIKGEIVEVKENLIVLDNAGIGYEINTSLNTIDMCGQVGEMCKLYTYYSVREDDISLFGFYTVEEKNLFLNLITVSGVGPRLALQVLSGCRIDKLTIAITGGDVAFLSKIKGIGKKTAERIVIDLKDKLDSFGTLFNYNDVKNVSLNETSVSEAVEVLVSLGINKTEAGKIVKLCYQDGDTAESLVTKALQNLGR